MPSYAALRARFLDDTRHGGSGAAPALARALEHIGWRSVVEAPTDEVASHLVALLDACVHEHHDVDLLVHATATLLRDVGPLLDGGLPPIDAYVPAAEEVLGEYVSPSARGTPDWLRG